MVEQGKFRKDLFYRLVTHHIHLPPLRERPDDIVLLAEYYMEKICAQFGMVSGQRPCPMILLTP
jgi:two-component system NtrC family response regulator